MKSSSSLATAGALLCALALVQLSVAEITTAMRQPAASRGTAAGRALGAPQQHAAARPSTRGVVPTGRGKKEYGGSSYSSGYEPYYYYGDDNNGRPTKGKELGSYELYKKESPSLASDIPLCRACSEANLTLVVDSEDDTLGDCYYSGGNCTLRQALTDANSEAGKTRIVFAKGVEHIVVESLGSVNNLPAIDASVCIDGGKKGVKVSVVTDQQAPITIVFPFTNNDNGNSKELCFHNLYIVGADDGISSKQQGSSGLTHIDVIGCKFEGQMEDGIELEDSDSSLLRVIDSTFLGSGENFIEIDSVTDGTRVEVVDTHFENSGGDDILINGGDNSLIVYGCNFINPADDHINIDASNVAVVVESIFYNASNAGFELDNSIGSNTVGMLNIKRCTIKRANHNYGINFDTTGNMRWNVEVVDTLLEENTPQAINFVEDSSSEDNKLVLINTCYDGIDMTTGADVNGFKEITSVDTTEEGDYNKVCKTAGVTRHDLKEKLKDLDEYFSTYYSYNA